LKKFFTRGDKLVITIFACSVVLIPVAIWILFHPRHFHCPRCGYGLHPRPCGKRAASLKRKHFHIPGQGSLMGK
jgi:hypothetical protein